PRPAGHHGAASPPLPPGRPAMSSRPSPAPSSGDRLPPRTRALRTAAIVLLVIALAVAIAALRGAFGGGGSRAGAIVDTMQGGGEALHAGFRRGHARGPCASGRFIAAGAAGTLASAPRSRSREAPPP